MVRHDKKVPVATVSAEKEDNYTDPVIGEIRNGRKIVAIDKKTQLQVTALFISKLKTIKINSVDLIQNSTPEMIIINPSITLDDLK